MNSFYSWYQLNEGIFNPKNRGKLVITLPDGTRQVAKYKVQSDNKFLIKLIRNSSMIDEGGNLTKDGANKMMTFINSQAEITSAIGTLNPQWFTDKFLIYIVKRDTQMSDEPGDKGREKIQFIVALRSEFPNVPAGANFVNSSVAQTGIPQDSPAIVQVEDIENTVVTDDTEENPEPVIQDETPEEQEVEETQDADLIGKKFRYSMRTNGKIYLMEFLDTGALSADVVGENDPNGVVSYSKEAEVDKINWTTDLDEGVEDWKRGWGGAPLFSDQEITNKIDRDFFIKIFTDKEFRDKIIAEYEAEWGGSEINAANLRSMLYYKSNGQKIFPEAAGTVVAIDKTDVPEVDNGPGQSYTGTII